MPTIRFAATSDLPAWAVVAALVLGVASLALLVFEMRRRERGGAAIVATGILAVAALVVAVLRPVRIAAKESVVGARVLVLADASRSMALTSDGKPRREARDEAIAKLVKNAKDARLLVLGFGDGAPKALASGNDPDATARASRSDLGVALRSIAASPDERPAAIVVVSDGRLDDPPENADDVTLRPLSRELKIPIHTIATTRSAPADASIRRVNAAGAAIAHVPLPLRVEVGCAGGLACDDLTVTARELRDDGPPALLASGLAHVKDGKATVDLTVTLERAGVRVVEVAIEPPTGDTIKDNDRRLLSFDVARERVRVLHVAGRPTNDVRELRLWLKSDASIDLVAFFILRTSADDAQTVSQDELALIPFPVNELFTEHLPTFDAIILQDIDAVEYQLAAYFGAIARYVRAGGGLVMVGGPNAFVRGGYAGTEIAKVLPVELDATPGATSEDLTPFVPSWTAQGAAAPLLGPLRAIVGDELPEMPGVNVLGDVRPGGVVLWTHPSRSTRSGQPMPVLAVGDEGDGRAVALGVDGSWRLAFSQLGARTAGRGHGALWDGLLGWLMRDPRFEPAQMDVSCTAGSPGTMHVRVLPGDKSAKPEALEVDVLRIDKQDEPPIHLRAERAQAADTEIDLPMPALAAGGYSARIHVGAGTTTRRDFACEAGGDEWADSRPDGDRLRAIAAATGGSFSWADESRDLPLPKPTVVSAERHVAPIAPPWAWALAAALALGAHWLTRRRAGLA